MHPWHNIIDTHSAIEALQAADRWESKKIMGQDGKPWIELTVVNEGLRITVQRPAMVWCVNDAMSQIEKRLKQKAPQLRLADPPQNRSK